MNVVNRISRLILSGVIAASLGAFACASTEGTSPDEMMPSEFEGAPGWVLQGCSAYWGDSDDARVCGVGSARIINANVSMAGTTATNRARAEISRSLELKVKTMVKDYQEQMTDGEDAMTAEQVVVVTKSISKTTLNGTAVQDTWISPSSNLYKLVALDIASFNNSMKEMDNLSDRMREFIEKRSAKSFKELDDEIEKEY